MMNNLVTTYNSLRSGYLERTPHGKWCFVRNIGHFVTTLAGFKIFERSFKPNWYSFVSLAAIVDFFVSTLYTVWYYANSSTPIKSILPASMFGIVIPSLVSFCHCINPKSRKMLQRLLLFSGDEIYVDNKCTNENYIRKVNESAIKLLKTTAITIAALLIFANIYLVFPIYAFYSNNEIQLPTPALLPFTHLETSNGIEMNMLNQGFLMFFGATANVGIEITQIMYKNSVWATTVAICHSIDELSTAIEAFELTSRKTINYWCRNILVQIQDLNRYILDLSNVYYWKLFIQPILLIFSISLSLFVGLFGIQISGFGIALFSYIQLFILCDIGDEIESANHMLVRKLKETPWYLMSVDKQRDLAHILARLQNGTVLRIGPFGVLNYKTFSDMSQRIYSLIMMLIRCMK